MPNTLKICLGTVQFGIQYGISNKNGVPTDEELNKIFSVANQDGIQFLDTARAYGNAEERIGALSQNRFKLVSKFPSVTTQEALKEALAQSLEKLNCTAIYGYLAHNATNIIEQPSLWQTLLQLKNEQKVERIGYSLYQPEQLDQLLDLNCVPDLVQLPYSILDRKFEKHLTILKELGTEIHVRSVFLQGLYFMNPKALPEKLQPLSPALTSLHDLCKEYELSVGEVALRYAYDNPNIDQVVMGIETATQLQENIQLVSTKNHFETLFSKINDIKISDKNLLNPANW